MKVLMISGDANLLKTGAAARERHALHASVVEKLDVFVWPRVHSAAEIRRAARAGCYDIVSAQDPFWRGFLAWRLARATGARLNLQVHADLSGQSLIKRMLARFLLHRADSVRVVSERLKREAEQLGIQASVTVLPVFVDTSRLEGLVRRRHPRFEKTILWIGRFEREKDPLAALAVLQEVRAASVDAGLVMLGSGSMEPQLRKASAGLPVEFPGWAEPKEYLAAADVVLSTSPYESYGASIVEALVAGVPVVAPDVGVAREAGAVVVPRERFAEAVAEVLKRGQRGHLKLQLPTAKEWAAQWKQSL
jgi:glycosyltransferase involved in cell wall biosynthesis